MTRPGTAVYCRYTCLTPASWMRAAISRRAVSRPFSPSASPSVLKLMSLLSHGTWACSRSARFRHARNPSHDAAARREAPSSVKTPCAPRSRGQIESTIRSNGSQDDSERELRNNIGAVLREGEAGATFTITVRGATGRFTRTSARRSSRGRRSGDPARDPRERLLYGEAVLADRERAEGLIVDDPGATNGANVDTSVVVVGEPFADALPEPVSISLITIGELRAGVLRALDRTQRDQRTLRTRGGPACLRASAGGRARCLEVRGAHGMGCATAGARRRRPDFLISATATATDRRLYTLDRRQASFAKGAGLAVQSRAAP